MWIVLILCIIFFAPVIYISYKAHKPDKFSDPPIIINGITINRYNTDKLEAMRRVGQLTESYAMVQNTTKPDIFFKRLSFCFDCLLDLMTYKSSIFEENCGPEQDFKKMSDNVESLVDDFLNRAYQAELEKIDKLKTEKGKLNRIDKFFQNLNEAFENANAFWSGNGGSAHYNGPLYTEHNRQTLDLLTEKAKNSLK